MNFIWITTQFEGIHKYPDAPEDVAFLKNEHRHMFHVKIWLEVFHDNREVEFIMFKRYIETILLSGDLQNKSCEMISDHLCDEVRAYFQHDSRKREIRIEVSEDGENGSYKEYPK